MKRRTSGWSSNDKKLAQILLAASEKAVTGRWLKSDPPTIEKWIEIIHDIYIMERLSFSLRIHKEKCYLIWTKWTEYIKAMRSDFN